MTTEESPTQEESPTTDSSPEVTVPAVSADAPALEQHAAEVAAPVEARPEEAAEPQETAAPPAIAEDAASPVVPAEPAEEPAATAPSPATPAATDRPAAEGAEGNARPAVGAAGADASRGKRFERRGPAGAGRGQGSRRQPGRERSFEELLLAEMSRGGGGGQFRKGDRVRGRIVRLDDKHAHIQFGGATEALLPLDGVRDVDGKPTVQVGQLITATVVEVGDSLVVTKASRTGRDRAKIRKLFQAGTAVEGRVTGTNKGGFDVQIGRFRAFCPISQIDRLYCQNPQEYVGKQFQFMIIEFKDGGRRFVVSRRALIEEERKQLADRTRAALQVGDELDGAVVRLQPFGAFIDIGGLEGLVHISEFRYERVKNPSEVVSVGMKLKVKVIGIENLGNDDGERISLSVKALADDPWLSITDTLKPGTTIKGKVSRLQNYGAFVQVLPGIEGLVHVTEFGSRRIRHPQEVIAEGDEVEAKVIEVDTERRRVSLSMRDAPQLRRAGGSAAPIEVGTVIDGQVTSIKPYGIFVRIESPQAGLDGLVPTDETDAPPGGDLSALYAEGTSVKAKVVRVDQRGRIRLSIRALSERREAPPRGGPKADSSASGASMGIMADAFKRAQDQGAED